MKKKVVLYKSIPEEQLSRLKTHFEISCFEGINDLNRASFVAALAEAEGLIGASAPMPAAILDKATKLKAVSTISVGTDQFDLDYLAARNVPLMHTPLVLTDTTADTIFMLMMCTARRAVELSNMVREGRWQASIGREYFGVDVHGKTLGVVGMGRIGYALAKRAHLGFDMKINYFNNIGNARAEQDLHAQRMDLATLLKTSDFVCVVLPLTPETEKMFAKAEFEMMKKGAIFINGSRGKIVNEADLITALQNKTIRAAGLDVFEVEPLPGNSPLCSLDNAVLLPHIGSATVETRLKMVSTAVDNLIAALNGDISKNCANANLMQ
ncbi:MAG TPA: D-glycerate dehydrogenase [Psychromonas sp.]